MFKRRAPRTTLARLGRALWPRGGWIRAIWYVLYRIRRLPDPAYKISRGIAVGVFVSFLPLFGLHFLLAAGFAWLLGGNVLAALLATFVGNPITFPLIAGGAVELGSAMIGRENRLPLGAVFDAFSDVSVELWINLRAVVLGLPSDWTDMGQFFEKIFLPYLIGGTVLGILAGVGAYLMTRPVIAAYQKTRMAKRRQRAALRRAASDAVARDAVIRRKGDEA